MPTHAAFLKGMNLGGRRITNDDLRACIERLGLEDVQTFRASGNVVFDGGARADTTLQRLLEDGLRDSLGYEVPTFVRSRKETLALAEAEPFDAGQLNGAGKLQIALLHERPSAATRKKALALSSDQDRLSLSARELFWLPAGGVSDSKLDWKLLERLIGPTTVRTMGTVQQLANRYFDS